MITDGVDLATLNHLLAQALDLAPAERETWLAALDATHAPLQPTLRRLLQRADLPETGDFLRTLPKLHRAEPGADHRTDERIGPYRLVRALGQGGMGTVWLAERADGTLKRQVALKLPLIASQPQMRERLLRERDVLAALEHPNIARLYDAGVDAGGQPYLALEYIEGQPIDVYCRDGQFDVRGRLRVFVQVARAVAYAHARLILHRDLKPTNILVTADGEARLLDFGVAKLMEAGGTRETELTQIGGRALTPDYASPEQIVGQPLTVASDVYSLGVVLYELLTGERPYRLRRDSRGALEDSILATAPQAPSGAVNDRRVRRQLTGDLDTIVLKALKKAPAERYATVAALADDIDRHLAGAPVLARPDSLGYRLSRLLRKHKLPVAVGAAIGLALLGGALPSAAVMIALAAGAGAALWQAGVARREAKSARTEARRAERVKQFIESIFTQATPRQGAGGVVTAFDLLAAAGERVEHELAGEPRVAAELGVLIGASFEALGEPIRGVPPLEQALERTEREFGPRHPLTLRAKNLLISALSAAGKYAEAERLSAQAVPDVLATLPASAADAVSALRNHAYLQAKRNEADASYDTLRKAIEIGERELGRLDERTIDAVYLLSNTYARFANRPAQLASAEDALRRATEAFGHLRPHTTLTLVERIYGAALTSNDRPGDAARMLRRVLEDQRALDQGETVRVQMVMNELAPVLHAIGQSREAVAMMRRGVQLEAQLTTLDSDRRHVLYHMLGGLLVETGFIDEGLEWIERAQAMVDRLGNEPPAWGFTRALRRARAYVLLGRDEEASRHLGELLAREAGRTAVGVIDALLLQALNARLQNRADAALAFARRALEAADQPTSPRTRRADAAAEHGRALLLLGDIEQAGHTLQRAVDTFAAAQVPPSVRSSQAHVGLAQALLAGGLAADAEHMLRPVVANWDEVNPEALLGAEARLCLARAVDALGRAREAAPLAAAAREVLRRSNLPALRAALPSG
jgi:eukaryotic-like serine/threonine-protein kinase